MLTVKHFFNDFSSWHLAARVMYRFLSRTPGPINYWCLLKGKAMDNTAYPENTNFETFVPRNLKFDTSGVLHTTKNAENFNLISQIVLEL